MSKRSRFGAARMRLALGEPSAEILRVELLSLWRCSIFLFSLLANRCLEVVLWFAPLLSRSRSVLPQLQHNIRKIVSTKVV